MLQLVQAGLLFWMLLILGALICGPAHAIPLGLLPAFRWWFDAHRAWVKRTQVSLGNPDPVAQQAHLDREEARRAVYENLRELRKRRRSRTPTDTTPPRHDE